ncbi:hypothetical protein like AT1G47480 [Hibiscus trionum]|uniref:Alpha/beta hydrolase fold-3 domain-containing protein n=1 Tax=Hibiscus trionum TaxID=183268 RepID=A0A9W7I9D9_HIBTR|nr:hypothetical protein like AT1G47480 [Hibiscus trionum]
MDSKEVALDLFPYLKVYKDGTLERIAGVEVVSPGLDPETNVLSKDIVIVPETGVSARIYRPTLATEGQKLPLVVYFHGGAFCVASPAFPNYHNSLNKLVAEANVVALSVDYRLVPEHPLPTAFEDSWAALQWVASHKDKEGNHESWIKDYAEFENVFLAGDSAGATIAHHLALRIKESSLGQKLKILGIGMIHPYFWGSNPIGSELSNRARKELVDKWWLYVCPSDKGCDDPLINPFVDGSPDLAGLACDGILVIVAEKDILKDRGMLYYDEVVKSGWKGKAEIMETEGEDHVFHIFNPDCDNAKSLIKRLASFLNQGKAPAE